MNLNRLKTFLILLLITLCSVNESVAQNDKEGVEVALRMIGHQLLLNSDDSTSLVLPIKNENKKFRISFEEAFKFVPTELVSSIDSIFNATNTADHYRVELENVDRNEIVYSYEVGSAENSVIPCRTRNQPKQKYDVLVSLLDENGNALPIDFDNQESESRITIEEKSSSSMMFGAILFLIIGAIGFGVYFWMNRKRSHSNSNKIQIGKYHFDEPNMKLFYKKDSIDLTSKETDLLMLLHSSKNETLERDEILKVVWGDEGDYVGRTLDVFISKLRKKFSEDGNIKIVNVRGVGYKLMLSESSTSN